MFDELKISESLLHSKAKLRHIATPIQLNSLWVKWPVGSNEEKEGRLQMEQCMEDSSSWIVRKTPKVTEFYNIGNVLGNPGQYGVVKQGIDKITKKKYAVKIVSKRRFRDRKLTHSFFCDLRAEVHLMSETKEHPFIINIRHVFEDINNLCIVMEYCEGGELFDRIQTDDGFSEKKASELMRQMLSAIYYLHSLRIAHCDLKPENFIFKNNSKDSKLKLIDFGMAKIVRWREYYKRMNGTPYYIAPEVLNGKYNESCDMWSLATNERSVSDKVIYKKIQKGFVAKVQSGYGAYFPSNHKVSAQCRDLISRLLRTSVADRITAEEALEHPWIKEGAATTLSNSKLSRIDNPTIVKSIRLFNQDSILQIEVLKLLKECNYLNTSQINEVKTFFDEIDLDKDGKISAKELYIALKKIDKNITEEDTKSIVKSLDADRDGFINCDELLSTRINRKLASKEARLRKVFQALDLDNNGYLTLDELKAALESVSDKINISEERCVKMINQVDKNNDGKIDFEEFIGAFNMDQADQKDPSLVLKH